MILFPLLVPFTFPITFSCITRLFCVIYFFVSIRFYDSQQKCFYGSHNSSAGLVNRDAAMTHIKMTKSLYYNTQITYFEWKSSHKPAFTGLGMPFLRYHDYIFMLNNRKKMKIAVFIFAVAPCRLIETYQTPWW